MLGTLNPTLAKFYAPEKLLFETAHWVAVVRPAQITLGAAILIAKSTVTSVAELSDTEMVDLRNAMQRLTGIHTATFKPDKVNYVALMMVDPNPHFHVLPRYETAPQFDGHMWPDTNWPKPPVLTESLDLSAGQFAKLCRFMAAAA